MHYMFAGDKLLLRVDAYGWDTSNVRTMACMFCVGDNYVANGMLQQINGIGEWDVSNVADMTAMFYGAGKMRYYDISRWNVGKVQSMNHMFCDNRELCQLDLSGWDVSSLKTINNIFDDNYQLTSIGDVSHWNTSSLIDASCWLNGATSFVGSNGTLDLSGWDTRNVKSTQEMFRATRLKVIDLSGWTFDAVTNSAWEGAGDDIYYEYTTGMRIMFKDTPLLQTVYLSADGLASFEAAVERGVAVADMWLGSAISGFTVKP